MAANRKAAQSEATRKHLTAVAGEVFTREGYSGASIEEIVRRAGVTRGALYHHFENKQDLFRAVFEQMQRDLAMEVAGAASAESDGFSRLAASLRAILRASLDPGVRQVALKDGTSVLGWQESREIMERYTLGAIKGSVALGVQAGQIRQLPVDATAHLLLGAVMEAAALIAWSPKPEAAVAPAEAALTGIIDALRS